MGNIYTFPDSASHRGKLMIRKTLTITLIAFLLVSTIPTVWALQIERPDYWTGIKKLIGNGQTDDNASVTLGVFVDRYDHDVSEYGGAGLVTMNVSMIGNTRMGDHVWV